MEKHIGVKQVLMQPMNRADYNVYRGWDLPADEDGADEGYLVEYVDGGKPNHKDHDGYISWSPKVQADNAYRRADGMSFGLAIEAAKKGLKIARKGWNGKGIYVYQEYSIPGYGNFFAINTVSLKSTNQDATRTCVPWIPSQTDMDRDDWFIVE